MLHRYIQLNPSILRLLELIAKKGAKIRYTTIQNWSKDVYNLVTKRAYAYENASVEWIDGNLGSRLTMKYPGVYMLGRNAHARSYRSHLLALVNIKMQEPRPSSFGTKYNFKDYKQIS